MHFSSQSESVEGSAIDAGTPLKNGVLKNRVWHSLEKQAYRCLRILSPFSSKPPRFGLHVPPLWSGSRKGGLSKGAFCAKQTFLQGNGVPSAVPQGNGLPSAVVTRHALGLGKSVQTRTGLGSCKSHLQVQTPQGRSLASASGRLPQWAGDRPVF